jgi:hypothetical protein
MIRLLMLLILLATPALALDPERREAIVISGRLWDGFRYVEMFLPSDNPVLTVMAGRDSAISFVRTEEYYWPLSRQVYVDFERQRDPVAGVLRIEKGGAVVAEIAEEPYAILYPDGAINGDGSLLWGPEAEQGYAAYQEAERAFNRRFVEAQRAQSAYERDLLEAARQGSKAAIPEPPPLPEPSLRLVTRPESGLRIGLEPGDYLMTLVADGAEVPGTERRLRVISPEERPSIVADVLPEERWTRPLASNAAEDRIYAKAGSTLYLTLAEASRFRETDYLAVVSPQVPASPRRNIWVRRKPAEVTDLELRSGSEVHSIGRSDLKVEQTSSSGFGYTIRATIEGETPDLQAFGVSVPEAGTGRVELALEPLGFSREVVPVGRRNTGISLMLSLLPLGGFAAVSIKRRLPS